MVDDKNMVISTEVGWYQDEPLEEMECLDLATG